MAQVVIKNVSKIYPAKKRQERQVVAVKDANLTVESGEIHAIIGYSGAGKSTLLRLINGLERASAGSITVGESANIAELNEKELRGVRKGIGMIFQQFNLFNAKTVAQNIAYPLKQLRDAAGKKLSAQEINARVAELLQYVGLLERKDAYPAQLSGGQKQRVGIARALAAKPQVLLADEATSALDPETSREVLELLAKINRELGVTIILITHEMDVVREIAHTVSVMENGKIIEHGQVFDVFANPRTAAAQQFVQTALPSQPNQRHISELRAKHRGKIVTLTLRDGDVDQPLVFQTLADRGVGVNILHGGIVDISGRSFGSLTLELIGDQLQVVHAIAALGQVAQLEVLA